MDSQYGCCISGNQYQQRCNCNESPLSRCKNECDQDVNCKGYVDTTMGTCQFATTSPCPSGCDQYESGNIEALQSSASCGLSYKGCHIKNGKTIILSKKSVILIL